MRVISVNVGLPKNILIGERSVATGIFKQPVGGRVRVGKLNLDGDRQADLRVHGGPDQAVYAYPVEHYDYWRRELGRELPYGQFGENFTVLGMLEDEVRVGDVFQVGDAQVQVTNPRVPCSKLAFKMGSARFPKRFLKSGRLGYSLRVLVEGEVGAGDRIVLLRTDPQQMTIREVGRSRLHSG